MKTSRHCSRTGFVWIALLLFMAGCGVVSDEAPPPASDEPPTATDDNGAAVGDEAEPEEGAAEPEEPTETKSEGEENLAPTRKDGRGEVTLAMTIYTRMDGETAARISEPENLVAAVKDDCDDELCRAALEILEQKGAVAVSLGETVDLPAPQFVFPQASAVQADAMDLEEMPRVVMIGVRGPVGPPYRTLLAAHLLARRVGTQLEGMVFDPETLMLWRPDEVSLPDPESPLPAAEHVSLGILPRHTGNYRVVTFGMKKLRCPDLVIEEVQEEDLRLMTAVVGAVAVHLAHYGPESAVEITADEVKAATREGVTLPDVAEGARGKTMIHLGDANRRESDPDNELRAFRPGPLEEREDFFVRVRRDLYGE